MSSRSACSTKQVQASQDYTMRPCLKTKQPQMIGGPKSKVPETLYFHEQTAVQIWLWAVIAHCSAGMLFEIFTEDVSFKMFTVFLVKRIVKNWPRKRRLLKG